MNPPKQIWVNIDDDDHMQSWRTRERARGDKRDAKIIYPPGTTGPFCYELRDDKKGKT